MTDSTHQLFYQYVQALDEEAFLLPVTSNWTVHDVIAHLVGWERECAKALPAAWKTKIQPWFMKTDYYDDFNARNVAEFRSHSKTGLITEWRMWQEILEREIHEIGEESIAAEKDFGWVLDSGENSHNLEHFNQIKRAVSKHEKKS